MTEFGEWSMWLAVALTAATVALSLLGRLRKRAELTLLAQGTTVATFAAVLVAIVGLVNALLTRDFALRYVATNTSVNLPRLYTAAALWAGHQGALLLWILTLAAWASAAMIGSRNHDGQVSAWTTAILGLVVLYFLGMMIVGANPFARMDFVPGDGLGMNPRLQVPGMLLHPPLLTAALAATSVPFALASAALVTRRGDIRALHGWSVLAWLLLTLSILTAFWSDYISADWTGRWARDFARDSIVLPWISCSALIFVALARSNETARRAREWALVLAVVTFALALCSAYLASAGIFDSVHAYAPSPVAKGFLIMAVLAVLPLAGLWGWKTAGGSPATSPDAMRPAASARWLMLAGAIMLAVGRTGIANPKQTRLTLATGASASAVDRYGRSWTFASQGISLYTELNKQLLVASLAVSREGRRVGMIAAEQRQFIDSDENAISKPIAVPIIRSSLLQDMRVSFLDTVDRGTALVQIEFVPLASWIWLGGLLTAIGGVILAMANQPKGEENAAKPRVTDDDVEAAIRRASATLIACPDCGPRPEADAIYCSNCGRKLA